MSFEKYIAKNKDGRALENPPRRKCLNAVVIPAYAEMESLPRTLESLSRNPQALLDDSAVVLVVNNPPAASADPAGLEENSRMLESLRNSQFPCQDRLNLHWIDASGDGRGINPKEGVGAARKLGMDMALEHLDFDRGSPLMISLDADTIVEGNYLESINAFFKDHPKTAGASISFAHQPGATPEEDAAITRYELFMRYYVIAASS